MLQFGYLCDAGKLNGFGHIQFDSAEAVQRALTLHGSQLMGREIFVDAASNRPGPPPLPAGKPVEGCWFCLSNPNADVELVASVGEQSNSPNILTVHAVEGVPDLPA